jgi:hypothetical protein
VLFLALQRIPSGTKSPVEYGDTDSIFSNVGSTTEAECMDMGTKLKYKLDESLVGTPFEDVKADMKGN